MKPAATTGANASTPAPSRDKTSASFCTQCGHRLADQHRFCGFCGTPVG